MPQKDLDFCVPHLFFQINERRNEEMKKFKKANSEKKKSILIGKVILASKDL